MVAMRARAFSAVGVNRIEANQSENVSFRAMVHDKRDSDIPENSAYDVQRSNQIRSTNIGAAIPLHARTIVSN